MLNKQVEELRNTHPNTKEWTQEQRLDFFKNNKKLIYACINKYNSRSSRSKIGYDNEDLFQEASLAFWGAFDVYNPESEASFCTYLHIVMDNAIKEILRKQNAIKRYIDATAVSYDAVQQSKDDDDYISGENKITIGLAPATESVEDVCIKSELIDLINRIMDNSFTQEEKTIFLALSGRHKTQIELASQLGCSQSKISMTYNFAKIKLQQKLKELGYGYDDLI